MMSYLGSRSPYGVYRTRTFADIFDEEDKFIQGFRNSKLNTDSLNDDDVKATYYLLYSRYGNSHILSSDENRFKYCIYSTMFSFGPTWAKRLQIQKRLRELTEEDLREGTRGTFNRAMNPETEPSTVDTEELAYVNEQNVQKYKKSKVEGYAMLWALLDTDVTTDYVKKFEKFFIRVLLPEGPLYYEEDI